MRAKLFVLTMLWVSTGIATFPFLYLVLAFANDNSTLLIRALTIYLLVFYFQLIVQSFIAAASLKHIDLLKQYLFAVLAVLLSPILLFVGIPIGMQLSSDLILQIVFIVVAILQLMGSIWIWVLIGTKKKQTTSASTELSRSVAISTNTYSAEAASSTAVAPGSRKGIAHILLYAPVIIFSLTVALVIATSITAPIFSAFYPSFVLSQSPIIDFIFTSLGGLIALSIPPCLAAGIYLIVQRKS